MAIKMPKTKRNGKEKINYSKLAEQLKGKVSFPVDLRKSDKNPAIPKGEDRFSFGQKMALLKAARELREMSVSTQFVPIKRQKGESKKAYKQRLSQTKKDIGQQGTHFPGVWLNTPDFTKTKTKREKNEAGKWTTKIETTVKGKPIRLEVGLADKITIEKFIPIPGPEFALNPDGFLNQLKKEFPDADKIIPIHSGFRSPGSGMRDKKDYMRFKKKLRMWANQYDTAQKEDGTPDYKKQKHWLSGFLVVWYKIVPRKGAKGKPVIQ